MTGVDRQHYGLEAALVYQLTSKLSLNFVGTVSEARYVNNPYAQLSYQGMDAATVAGLNVWSNPVTGEAMPMRVIADGMRVSGTPLTALSVGAEYNVSGWIFGLNLNYYDRVYVGYSQYRRLSNVLNNHVASSYDVNGNLVYDVTADEIGRAHV